MAKSAMPNICSMRCAAGLMARPVVTMASPRMSPVGRDGAAGAVLVAAFQAFERHQRRARNVGLQAAQLDAVEANRIIQLGAGLLRVGYQRGQPGRAGAWHLCSWPRTSVATPSPACCCRPSRSPRSSGFAHARRRSPLRHRLPIVNEPARGICALMPSTLADSSAIARSRSAAKAGLFNESGEGGLANRRALRPAAWACSMVMSNGGTTGPPSAGGGGSTRSVTPYTSLEASSFMRSVLAGLPFGYDRGSTSARRLCSSTSSASMRSMWR